MRAWLHGEFAVAAQLAGIDQGLDIQWRAAAGDARTLEQADHEGLQRLRTRGFTHRLLALPPGESQQSDQGERCGEGERDRKQVAAHELARAIRQALRPRQDGQAIEVALDVE